MGKQVKFIVNRPDPEKAQALASKAARKTKDKDVASAITLIEEAIRLDFIGALNDYHELRAELYSSIGRGAHQRALMLYTLGTILDKKRCYRDAEIAYTAAADLDPVFLWPLNNIAWMFATDGETSIRDGKKAVKHAIKACSKSNWNCWAFVGTLAAAYAKAGDLERAIGWQKASLQIVPADQRSGAEEILRCFESGMAFVDKGHPVAAGVSSSQEEAQEFDEERLKRAMRELMDFPTTGVH